MSGSIDHLIGSLSSHDTNIMLAAVISLLLVILFVLLLHIYAKWFLYQAHQRQRSNSVLTSSQPIVVPSRIIPQTLPLYSSDDILSAYPSKGLEPSIIASIPTFVYKPEDHRKEGLEDCVICLSKFEENEVGRIMTMCDHGFHVECIDMWLYSHSNCPVCRAPAAGDHHIGINVKSLETSGETEAVSTQLGLSENNESGNRSNLEVDHSSSSSSSSSLGCSLKRMLSRNRSERKVSPSFIVTELDA